MDLHDFHIYVSTKIWVRYFSGKKGPLSIVNSLAMYEVQLTQNILLNQASFCWPTWQIHVTTLKPVQKLHVEMSLK